MTELASSDSILKKIDQGLSQAVEEVRTPARIPGGGFSLIISYYEACQYICTVHKIVTNEGKVYHHHLKHLCVRGVDYRLD